MCQKTKTINISFPNSFAYTPFSKLFMITNLADWTTFSRRFLGLTQRAMTTIAAVHNGSPKRGAGQAR
jgi:hypothetical protein